MSDIPDPARYPAMTPGQAEQIARGLNTLARSFAHRRMPHEAERYRLASLLWMQRAMGLTTNIGAEIAAVQASMAARFSRIDAGLVTINNMLARLCEQDGTKGGQD